MRLKALVAVLLVFLVGGIVLITVVRDRAPAPEPIPLGTALDLGNEFAVEAPLGPGQEVVDMFAAIRNSSDSPIRLIEITPIAGEGVPQIGVVVDVFLVDSPFLGSLYNALPPVMRTGARCMLADTSSVTGYVLEPGEEVMVATHVRALMTGEFELNGREILYEQDGRTFRQRDPYVITGIVDPATTRQLLPEEKRCRAQVTLLPAGS